MAAKLNSAPMFIAEGIDDKSFVQVPPGPLSIPQHLPVFYLFAEKGPVGTNYLDLAQQSLTEVYGSETFNVHGKYYTHQTVFAQKAVANANSCVIRRVIPGDAKDRANVALYLDVLETEVPLYEKNSDGSLVLDDEGNPTPKLDGTGAPEVTTGYQVAWVTDFVSEEVGNYVPGTLTQRQGVQSSDGAQSTQYPIFEFAARDIGDAGNKLAIRLSAALRTDMDNFPGTLLEVGKQYPYYFGMVRLEDPVSDVTSDILNRFGSVRSLVTLDVNGVDPSTDGMIGIDHVVNDDYIDVDVSIAGGLGLVKTYQDNILEVSKKFYEAEALVADEHTDAEINVDEENYFAVNIVSFVNSNGSPYQSVKLVDIEGTTRLTQNSNIYLGGGDDGTLDYESFEALIRADLKRYVDPLEAVSSDMVAHPESIIYDSGFTLETKKEIANLIGRRKDTFVVLSTFVHGENLTVEQQFSLAVTLRTVLEMYPESTIYGTPVTRGMIIGGSGEIIASNYRHRVPSSYDILHKASLYMGNSNGYWVEGRIFDRAPGSVVSTLKNIDITHVPATTRTLFWAAGMNFTLNSDIRNQFFPALKTVYHDDTSVLNSFFVVMAACYLTKLANEMWIRFSGSTQLTNAQLEDAVNTEFEELARGRFDGVVRAVGDCKVTERDELKGFSWTLNVTLYGNGMKTVMTTKIEARRMADYFQGN